MAVVSQGTMNQVETLRLAGNHFDDEITKYLHDEYGILIGKRTAEEVKKNIGGVVPRKEDVVMQVKGRDMITGLPGIAEITGNELYACLKPLFDQLANSAVALFESSELYGIDKMFSEALNLDVTIAPRAELCVAKGAMVALNKMHLLDQYGYRFRTKQDVRIK